MKVLLAHGMHDSETQIEDWKQIIESIFRSDDLPCEVVLGREDHKENFASSGGWGGWTFDVVMRKDYMTQDYHYGAIIVPGEFIGKATAQIVQHALDHSRPVLLLWQDRELVPVQAIDRIDDQDFKQGWRVVNNDYNPF